MLDFCPYSAEASAANARNPSGRKLIEMPFTSSPLTLVYRRTATSNAFPLNLAASGLEEYGDSEVFDRDWFGTASPDNPFHTVDEGRWAYLAIQPVSRTRVRHDLITTCA